MTFGETAHSSLASRLAVLGYGVIAPIENNRVHFQSSAFDVVVYFDEQNMDINARVRRRGAGGRWSFIRELVAGPNVTMTDVELGDIKPTPVDECIRELGELIERLPK